MTQDQPKEYVLTEDERAAILNQNAQVTQIKANIADLNEKLEQLAKDKALAEAAMRGAIGLLAHTHKMPQAQLSPDATKLIKL